MRFSRLDQVFRRSGVQAFRSGLGIHRMDRISGIERRSDAADERLQDTKRE